MVLFFYEVKTLGCVFSVFLFDAKMYFCKKQKTKKQKTKNHGLNLLVFFTKGELFIFHIFKNI